MRQSEGYAPGFSSSTRIVPMRPAGATRALRLRRRPRVPRRLLRGERRTAHRSRKLIRALRPKAKKGLTPEQRLVQRATMGLNLAELARISELGYNAWLDGQLDWASIDDGGFEDELNTSLRSLSMTPYQLYQNFDDESFRPVIELMVASVLRAAYSPRQLYERMVIFWSDHFAIDIFADHGYLLKMTDDREVIRPHALGNFRDLLGASAHSPAMLEYLTNDTNVKGHPNENYARELMELHTLGVDGPYTQKDVREVARAFTGWTLHGVYSREPQMGTFRFANHYHDKREKVVLGRVIPSGGGEEDGEQILDLLATHPKTADFIAEKLVRYFWGYKPKRKLVRKAARKFLATDGDIAATVKVILARKQMQSAEPKLKRPVHLMASAVRATLADVRDAGFLIEQLELAGHLPFAWSAPNGYPDAEDYWSGFILPRWNFAADFPIPEVSGARLDPALLDLEASPKTIAKRIDRQMFNRTLSKKTRKSIQEFLGREEITTKRLREAIGMAIAAPEFQLY